jgi:hypothetical protein
MDHVGFETPHDVGGLRSRLHPFSRIGIRLQLSCCGETVRKAPLGLFVEYGFDKASLEKRANGHADHRFQVRTDP